ncbi:MAG TPA: urease accessory protein UreD [Pseudonocardiaceae bacterium]|nr:urease accessory protein UreD [Pseudonocardiaceae bacterium]
MRARAELAAESGSDDARLWWRSCPPIALRQTGPRRVHLVQAAGGPLGGDELALDVHLGVGASLQVSSAAATVVQPGNPLAPTRWTVAADLADGAMLEWCPEPTVVCDGAELHSSMTVALRRGARAVLREVVVLGRGGQRGGRFHGEFTVERDGIPQLAHTLLLDGADAVLAGPAGTGGARVVGMLAGVGEGIGEPPEASGEEPGLRWACSALDGPGWLLLALGDRATDVAQLLDQAAQEVGVRASQDHAVVHRRQSPLSELARRASAQHEA